MEQPSIYLFGIMVQEPVTTLTDLLVSLVCFRAFIHLRRKKAPPLYFSTYTYFMLLMGIATLYGGLIGHGFLYCFSFGWKVPGWIISMLSIGFAERGAILHARQHLRKNIGTFFVYANAVEILFMVTITLVTLQFIFVEAHATYGLLLVVFSLEFFVYRRTHEKGSRLLLAAIAISALSATVHLTKFSLHTWFNFLDLSHVLMALALLVFHQGLHHLVPGKKEKEQRIGPAVPHH
jgi:hypothetical protein